MMPEDWLPAENLLGSESSFMRCSKCGHPLAGEDRMGSSAFVCSQCGGVTKFDLADDRLPEIDPDFLIRDFKAKPQAKIEIEPGKKVLRRKRLTRALWLLATLVATFALVRSIGEKPVIHAFAEMSLSGFAMGAACGILFLVSIQYAMFGASTAQIVPGVFIAGGGITLLGAFVIRPQDVVWIAPVVIAIAAMMLLYEQGLRIEINDDAIARRRWLPLPGTAAIAWRDVDSVKLNLASVTTVGLAISGDDYGWIQVAGGKNRIAISSVKYRLAGDEFDTIVSRSAASAISSTVDRVRSGEDVRLGPIALRPQGVVVRTLLGSAEIAYSELQDVDVSSGWVWFRGSHRMPKVKSAHVPNAVYLPQIVSQLSGT